MKEYRLRVYDDHYLVTDEAVGVGTMAVEYGNLEAVVALQPAKVKRPYPKGTRKRKKPEAKPAVSDVVATTEEDLLHLHHLEPILGKRRVRFGHDVVRHAA